MNDILTINNGWCFQCFQCCQYCVLTIFMFCHFFIRDGADCHIKKEIHWTMCGWVKCFIIFFRISKAGKIEKIVKIFIVDLYVIFHADYKNLGPRSENSRKIGKFEENMWKIRGKFTKNFVENLSFNDSSEHLCLVSFPRIFQIFSLSFPIFLEFSDLGPRFS